MTGAPRVYLRPPLVLRMRQPFRERHGLACVRRVADLAGYAAFVLEPPARQEHDGTPEHAREPDLGQGAPLAADRHYDIRRRNDPEVAGVADSGRDSHVRVYVRLRAIRPGQEADG